MAFKGVVVGHVHLMCTREVHSAADAHGTGSHMHLRAQVIAFAGADAVGRGSIQGGVPSHEFVASCRRAGVRFAIFAREWPISPSPSHPHPLALSPSPKASP